MKQLFYPLFSTIIFYLAFTLPPGYEYGLWGIHLFSIDFLLQLILGLLLYALSRNQLIFIFLQACLMGLLYLGSPLKMYIFTGDPLTPYDFSSMLSLYEILDTQTQTLISIPVVAFAGLFIYNLSLTKKGFAAIVIGLVLLPLGIYSASGALSHWFDAEYHTEPWRRSFNYSRQGPSVFMLNETVKMLNEDTDKPSRQDVAAALSVLGPGDRHSREVTSPPTRNLHIVLVESLWDARQLPSMKNGPDPFTREFRQLWSDTGSSVIYSPVYGAGTANAEFELLCGLPILSDRIVFEHEIHNASLPCLPNILKQHGYQTIAMHPNRSHYWNRSYAYPILGFGHYYSEDSFRADDMLGGTLLSTKSNLAQSRQLVREATEPLFSYTITIAEHFPYYVDDKRPELGNFNSGSDVLNRYLSVIHYTTSEIMTFLSRLREQDPNALIVVLGDHSPYLDANLAGYRDAGVKFEGNANTLAQTRLTMAATPLIVIDGKQGPVHMGKMALYQLPYRILDLLGIEGGMPLSASDNQSTRFRPIAGIGLLALTKSGVENCEATNHADKACKDAEKWRNAMHILRMDMLGGAQYQITLTH